MPNTAIQHETMNRVRPHEARVHDAADGARAARNHDQDGRRMEEGMTFWDVLDVVNPLQHIPVVNRLYRAITGDEIKTPAKLAGGALFLGPVGMALAAADAVVEHRTGKDTFENVAALFRGKEGGNGDVQLADKGKKGGGTTSAGTEEPHAMTPDGMDPAIQAASLASDLKGMPAASAAALSAAGLPPAAALASLPTPGNGTSANMLAALEGNSRRAEPARGMTLAKYRALAQAGDPTPSKPLVPPVAVQAAMDDRSRVGHPGTAAAPRAGLVAAGTIQAVQTAGAAEQALDARSRLSGPADEAATEKARADTVGAAPPGSAEPPAGTWPPGGPATLPKELIADMMMMAMDKYQAQAKSRTAPGH